MQLDTKCWEPVEAPLRRMIAAAIKQLSPKIEWRQLLKSNGIEPGKARDFAQVEIQSLVALLARNADQRPDRPTSLFGTEGAGERLKDQLNYLMTLRNKYCHDSYVPATEQVADLLLISRLAGQLFACCPTLLAERAAVGSALEKQLAIYWPAIRESGMAPVPDERADSAVVDEVTDQLRGIRDDIRQLQTVLLARPVTPGEKSDPQFLTLLVDLQHMVKDEALSAKEHLRSIDVRMSELVAETREAFLSNHESSSPSEAPPDDRVEPDVAPPVTSREHDTSDIDELLARVLTESRSVVKRSPDSAPRYSPAEIRDQLIQLRRRIWAETRTRASVDGLLRKRMIDYLIRYEVKTEEEFYDRLPAFDVMSTNRIQLAYLPDVLEVMKGLQ